MWFRKSPILPILDECAKAFTFPALDNGYVYLAAARLSAYAAKPDWAIVIEVFGFSPRAGFPDIAVCTFASKLHGRDKPENYVSRQAYDNYLARNPHNEFRSVFPIDEGSWQDEENPELLDATAETIPVRGEVVPIPRTDAFESYGITLEDPPRIHVFEACRFLAETRRADVLATPTERRVSVPPHLRELIVLDEWNHPDIVGGQKPSETETFQQLAEVLQTEDANRYHPRLPPDTHWSNWPEGGLL